VKIVRENIRGPFYKSLVFLLIPRSIFSDIRSSKTILCVIYPGNSVLPIPSLRMASTGLVNVKVYVCRISCRKAGSDCVA